VNDDRLIGGLLCSEVLAALPAFVDGSLDAETKEKAMAHVSRCSHCERFGGTYAEMVRRVRAAARVEDPEPAVLERLEARLAGLGLGSR
jgi:anti-sigma factor RsiW